MGFKGLYWSYMRKRSALQGLGFRGVLSSRVRCKPKNSHTQTTVLSKTCLAEMLQNSSLRNFGTSFHAGAPMYVQKFLGLWTLYGLGLAQFSILQRRGLQGERRACVG